MSKYAAAFDGMEADVRAEFDDRLKKINDARAIVCGAGSPSGAVAPDSPPPSEPTGDGPKKKKPLPAAGGVRQKVFAAMATWSTSEKIVQQTGLTPKQVRGVLSAKELQDKVDRRTVEGGGVEYKTK